MTYPRRTLRYAQTAILRLSASISLVLVPVAGHAQGPTEKVVQLPVGSALFTGASLQVRAGVSNASASDVGALLQPRIDSRSDRYGHFFAIAAATSGFDPRTDQTSSAAFGLG